MTLVGWSLAASGFFGLAVLVWWQGFAAPMGHLYGTDTPEEEAAFCLAVAERVSEITQGNGKPGLEGHLDEQVDFWRGRAGDEPGQGRATLGRLTIATDEGAFLHLAIQDCAYRAVFFYGHRFPGLEVVA